MVVLIDDDGEIDGGEGNGEGGCFCNGGDGGSRCDDR